MTVEDEILDDWMRRERAMAEKDETIAEHEETIAEHEGTIAEARETIAGKDEALRRQQAEINALRRQTGEPLRGA